MSAEEPAFENVEIEANEGSTTVTLKGTKIEISDEGDVTVHTDERVRARLPDEAEAPETFLRTDFNSLVINGTTIGVSQEGIFTVGVQGTIQAKAPSTDEAPLIGHKMRDGTIYAGTSPDTGKAMFVAPADAVMTFDQAQKRAKQDGTTVPSPAELHVILSNSGERGLAGTFNEKGGYLDYYLTSQKKNSDGVTAERASTGTQQEIARASDASVRFILRYGA